VVKVSSQLRNAAERMIVRKINFNINDYNL